MKKISVRLDQETYSIAQKSGIKIAPLLRQLLKDHLQKREIKDQAGHLLMELKNERIDFYEDLLKKMETFHLSLKDEIKGLELALRKQQDHSLDLYLHHIHNISRELKELNARVSDLQKMLAVTAYWSGIAAFMQWEKYTFLFFDPHMAEKNRNEFVKRWKTITGKISDWVKRLAGLDPKDSIYGLENEPPFIPSKSDS